MDVIETLWNKNQCITIVLDDENMEIYYFLLPHTLYYPNTNQYRRLELEVMESALDHRCDYYAKMIIRPFVVRLNCRLRTRNYIKLVEKKIPFPRTELGYHQQFIEKLRIESIESSQYETILLLNLLRESEEIVKEEQEYRPEGEGYYEVKQDFEELALLTTPIFTKQFVSAHKC